MKKRVGFLFGVFMICFFSTLTVSAEIEVRSLSKIEALYKNVNYGPVRWSGKEYYKFMRGDESTQRTAYLSDDGITFGTGTGLPGSYMENANRLFWTENIYVVMNVEDPVPKGIWGNSLHDSNDEKYYCVFNENFELLNKIKYNGRIIFAERTDDTIYYVIEEVEDGHKKNYYHSIYKKYDNTCRESEIPYRDNVFHTGQVSYETEARAEHENGARIYEYKTDSERYFSVDGIYFYPYNILEDLLPDKTYCFGSFPSNKPTYSKNMPSLKDCGWYQDGTVYLELYDEVLAFDLNFEPATYINVKGRILAFDYPPVVENDRTLVPMRFLFEFLGDTVTWDEETQTATAQSEGGTVTFGIDNVLASVNGKTVTLDVPARLISGKTYVPLRFLTENLGYKVIWDDLKRIAYVVDKQTIMTQRTDVQCTINGLWVESFAIDGNLYIPVDVLDYYDFNTDIYRRYQNFAIYRKWGKEIRGTTENKGDDNSFIKVRENTDRIVKVNGKIANTYMIGNRLVVQADELLVFGSGGFNPETRCFEIELKK